MKKPKKKFIKILVFHVNLLDKILVTLWMHFILLMLCYLNFFFEFGINDKKY